MTALNITPPALLFVDNGPKGSPSALATLVIASIISRRVSIAAANRYLQTVITGWTLRDTYALLGHSTGVRVGVLSNAASRGHNGFVLRFARPYGCSNCNGQGTIKHLQESTISQCSLCYGRGWVAQFSSSAEEGGS